ncbi:Sensory/regulatory protein RpfC [invertebrate metagenome]|uniref:Sensory/regulatory protein RpfC n=1 Tax=invertebrate metagenome TaxID=1711999 RepID=A0A2H9TBE8_9ZZZZ
MIVLLIASFGCFSLGVIFYLYSSLEYHFGELQKQDFSRRIESYGVVVEQFIDVRHQWLKDLSKNTIFTQAVMQPDVMQANLYDYMSRVRLLGKKVNITLLDFSGEPVFYTAGQDSDNYRHRPDIMNVLRGVQPEMFSVLKSAHQYNLLFAVAIYYNGLAEGVLLAEIPVSEVLEAIHPQSLSKNEQLQLFYKQDKLFSYGPDLKNTPHTDYYLLSYPLKITGYLDSKALAATSRQIQVQVALVIVWIAIVVIIAVFFIGRWLFINPINHLRKATQTLERKKFSLTPDELAQLFCQRIHLKEISVLSHDIHTMSDMILVREKALKEVNRQLEKRVEERTVELKEARDKACASDKAKSGFLATMSHEIRTPMNAILGIFELLKAARLTTQQKQWLHTAQSSGELLLSIINDILDFSALEAGKLELEEQSFNLHAIFYDAFHLCQITADNKKLKLLLNIAPDVPRVAQGDKWRLSQVLLNLLGNAIKFTKAGSVNLRVSISSKRGDVFTLNVAVRDTGIGIAESFHLKMFDEFTMKDQGFARTQQGTGLGLAICQRLLKLMGGELSYTSQEGVGSTFMFTAPLMTVDSDAERTTTEATSDLSFSDVNPNILLAEDNPANQSIIKAILEHDGGCVTIAHNGLEALQYVQKNCFDVILMDISMPEMDGITAARSIRDLPDKKNIPIISLSAHALVAHRKQFLQAGMNDCLTKPINKKKLLSTICHWTLQYRQQSNVPTIQTMAQSGLGRDELLNNKKEIGEYDWSRMPFIDEGVLQQLVIDTSAEVAYDLLGIYKEDTLLRIAALKSAVSQEDVMSLEYEAHTLGSSAGAHGNSRLLSCARYVETLCRDQHCDQAFKLAEILISEAEQSLDLLQKRREQGF